jgi:ABC-type transporter Mla MlaB component
MDTNVLLEDSAIGLTPMEMYLNDSVKTFEFVLQGKLTRDAAQSLQHAWTTAASILNGRKVLVDVSALTAADPEGIELLYRMTGSGARLTAKRTPQSEEFVRSLGVPVTAPSRRGSCAWMLGVRRLFGLSA